MIEKVKEAMQGVRFKQGTREYEAGYDAIVDVLMSHPGTSVTVLAVVGHRAGITESRRNHEVTLLTPPGRADTSVEWSDWVASLTESERADVMKALTIGGIEYDGKNGSRDRYRTRNRARREFRKTAGYRKALEVL